MSTLQPDNTYPTIAFIGGGNMASAIIGGLLRQGHPTEQIEVVEPFAAARDALQHRFHVAPRPTASEALARAKLVVWAVKPQNFKEATEAVRAFTHDALHLSVAAGIPTASIAQWVGSERIVRAMPNTPALIGRGMTALFARDAVSPAGRELVDQVIASTGQRLWVRDEAHLDAVTALSGSGPAYVFLFLEAMTQAGVEMGLHADDAYRLAVATFGGSAELAERSDESAQTLRQRVTSKGGTTHAAITHLQDKQVPEHFIEAMRAAEQRAKELASEFGR